MLDAVAGGVAEGFQQSRPGQNGNVMGFEAEEPRGLKHVQPRGQDLMAQEFDLSFLNIHGDSLPKNASGACTTYTKNGQPASVMPGRRANWFFCRRIHFSGLRDRENSFRNGARTSRRIKCFSETRAAFLGFFLAFPVLETGFFLNSNEAAAGCLKSGSSSVTSTLRAYASSGIIRAGTALRELSQLAIMFRVMGMPSP